MLRVVSYNIHSGRNLFMRDRLRQMAKFLSELNADVIGLQEVHQNSLFGYQAEQLAQTLNMSLVFGTAMKIKNGGFGNALLTKWPILRSAVVSLPARREPRCLLQSTLQWKQTEIEAWVTHCSLDKQSRQAQFQTLEHELAKTEKRSIILLGDLNTTAAPPSLHRLQDCAMETGQERVPTHVPFFKRVDFVLVSTDWKINDYQVINTRWSDHYPLLVTLSRPELPIHSG